MRRPPQEPAHGSLHAVDLTLQEQARCCPTDCVQLHSDLVFDANGHLWGTRCTECGLKVDLTVWQNTMFAGSRPWSRWSRWADDTA